MPKCGESTYLVYKPHVGGLKLPPGDLMIFDKHRAVVNTYNKNGLMTDQTFYDEQDNLLSNFLELRHQLLGLAKPL
ncbi:MAG: DUF6879 family protein [Candidatus Saccharimonadales bacterium]